VGGEGFGVASFVWVVVFEEDDLVFFIWMSGFVSLGMADPG